MKKEKKSEPGFDLMMISLEEVRLCRFSRLITSLSSNVIDAKNI